MRLLPHALSIAALVLAGAPGHAQGPAVPDAPGTLILVRTALVALNHANRTGNYTVLRDLAAPGFRSANTAARLARIFADLRSENLDLGPIVVVEPKLARQPFIDERGLLRITGHFPTRPVQVNFDLAYGHVNGRWRLFGISVEPVVANAKSDAPAPPR